MPTWLGGGGSVNVSATQQVVQTSAPGAGRQNVSGANVTSASPPDPAQKNAAVPNALQAIGAARAARTDVGGRIVLDINDQRTRVREVQSNNRDVPIDVNAGLMGMA